MKKIFFAVTLFTSPLLANPAYAQMNATSLAEHCSEGKKLDNSAVDGMQAMRMLGESQLCLGYVAGVFQAHDYLVKTGYVEESFCNNAAITITGGQMVDIFLRYYERNPKVRFSPAAEVVLKALADQFPCKR